MLENKQKLIIICGSPCVGKTSVAESLLYSHENSAHFDDDWVWRVNPFMMNEPRHKNCYKSMSFVLSNYLDSGFEHIFFSSVRMLYKTNRKSVLRDITSKGYDVIGFTLICSEETLISRHKERGDLGAVSFEWLNQRHSGDFVIDTDRKSVSQIADEIKNTLLKT